jgi:hypothetical protein
VAVQPAAKPKRAKTVKAKPESAPELGLERIENRDALIAKAAYYLAAKRNFAPGHELDDWLEAERSLTSK